MSRPTICTLINRFDQLAPKFLSLYYSCVMENGIIFLAELQHAIDYIIQLVFDEYCSYLLRHLCAFLSEINNSTVYEDFSVCFKTELLRFKNGAIVY